jgi:hypothetical protein
MGLIPHFTEFDPAVEGEGSLDPLGLEAGAEHLADRLLPGVTARMHRIRALTVLAVSAHVADPYLEEYTADQTTPGWLVFEWMYAEALALEGAEAWGIPGIWTTERVLAGGGHLAARVYIKSPVALGLHGYYRTLARATRVLEPSGHLGDNGDALVRAWEAGQGLNGFLDGDAGGGRCLSFLRKGLEQSLAKSRVAVGRQSEAILTLRRHLLPTFDAGDTRRERRTLRRILDEDEARRETLSLLDAELRAGRVPEQEAEIAMIVAARGSAELAANAKALIAYERLSALLTEAFDLARARSAEDRGVPLAPAALGVQRHSELVPAIRAAAVKSRETEAEVEYDTGRLAVIERFVDVTSPEELVAALLERHEQVQRRKGREGKRPWFERAEQGYAVRADYSLAKEPPPSDGFVHPVRLRNACEFLEELG